jgi:hypothetical protein
MRPHIERIRRGTRAVFGTNLALIEGGVDEARRLAIVGCAILIAVAVAVPQSVAAQGPGGGSGGGKSKPKGTTFGAPVEVTPDLGYGYEPAAVVDDYGNIFATAHKENWQLVLAPDPDSPTFTRSMSWDWVSVDDGQTWTDIPGLTPASLEQHEFGDEGDMAIDDANHLYFVDTSVTDVSITRWTTSGRGLDQIALDYTRPILPAAQPLDDRPWVTARGDSTVLYFGNEGDKETYFNCPAGFTGDCGPGRYTVYQSYDGGTTFDNFGYTLDDSGWCRPTSDHTGATYIYVICTNDEGKLYSYVSSDDGRNFVRYAIANYNADDPYQSWPTAEVAADGSIWALYVDANTDADGNVLSNFLRLFHSTNHGQTWKEQNITPLPGRYEYGWLSVASTKTLGLGIYYRPDNTSDWKVYGAIWTAGQIPSLVLLDPVSVQSGACDEANGDLMGSAFGPDARLTVVWTRNTGPMCGTATLREIWSAHSQ